MRVCEGDMFATDYDVRVCPVNLDGVMGAGLAKQFKIRYPGLLQQYQRALHNEDLKQGGGCIVGGGANAHTAHIPAIWLFPSKRYWRDKSHPEDIEWGIATLSNWCERNPSATVALPAVGCGLGGLSFAWLEDLCWEFLSGYLVDLFRPM